MFKRGHFELHSGGESDFLIDCGTLTDDDLVALANHAAGKLPPFGLVEGVPNGGMRFAEALGHFATGPAGVLLIVDDVCTTGASMEEQRAGREAYGVVIFARGDSWPTWVRPIFVMPP